MIELRCIHCNKIHEDDKFTARSSHLFAVGPKTDRYLLHYVYTCPETSKAAFVHVEVVGSQPGAFQIKYGG